MSDVFETTAGSLFSPQKKRNPRKHDLVTGLSILVAYVFSLMKFSLRGSHAVRFKVE